MNHQKNVLCLKPAKFCLAHQILILVTFSILVFLVCVEPSLAQESPVYEKIVKPVQMIRKQVGNTLGMAKLWDLFEKFHELVAKDWWNYRGNLEKRGLTFESVYTGDLVSVGSGGIKQGTAYLGNLEVTLTGDTEKAGLWKGGHFLIYGLENHGGKPTAKYAGDFQGFDNIEASQSTFRLYQMWYEQNFFDDRISILAGQHDLSSDFLITNYGRLFINSSFFANPEICSNVSCSYWPVAGLGTRVRASPWKFLDAQIGIYDGDPTNQAKNRHGLQWKLYRKESVMLIAEGGIHFGGDNDGDIYPGSYKFGGWHHGQNVDDLRTVTNDDEEETVSPLRIHKSNYGFYGIIDQMIFREKGDQGLAIFLQSGGVPNDRNQFDFYLGTGAQYKGILPGRDDDTLGAAVAYLKASNARLSTPGVSEANETAVEITYRIQVTPWFAVQSDLQSIVHPSADPLLDRVTTFLLRFEISA